MKTIRHQTSSRVDREIEAVIGRADAYLLATDLDLNPEQIRQRLGAPRPLRTAKNRRVWMARMDEAPLWAAGLGLLLVFAALLVLLCGLALSAWLVFRVGAEQYLEHIDVHRRVPDAATIIATITAGSAVAIDIAFWLGKRSGSKAGGKPSTDAKITQIHGHQSGSRTRTAMADESSHPRRRSTPGRQAPIRMAEDDDLVPLRRNSRSPRR